MSATFAINCRWCLRSPLPANFVSPSFFLGSARQGKHQGSIAAAAISRLHLLQVGSSERRITDHFLPIAPFRCRFSTSATSSSTRVAYPGREPSSSTLLSTITTRGLFSWQVFLENHLFAVLSASHSWGPTPTCIVDSWGTRMGRIRCPALPPLIGPLTRKPCRSPTLDSGLSSRYYSARLL